MGPIEHARLYETANTSKTPGYHELDDTSASLDPLDYSRTTIDGFWPV